MSENVKSAAAEPVVRHKKRSQLKEVWGRLLRNKLAVVSLVVIVLLALVAIFADYIAPYDYKTVDIMNRFQFPSLQHPMGTDNLGRDLLSRMIYGSRMSLLVAIMACVISLVIGGILGATSGYFGGIYDSIVMRIMDMLMAIPMFLMAVAVSSALGTGLLNSAIALAISGIPGYVRITRAQVMTVRDLEYIEASKASGAGQFRIVFKQILPNCLAPIIVNFTLSLGGSIMAIASLSFIGLGVAPPTPEWGSILSGGLDYIRSFWPIVTFPGIAITVTMLAFNLFGDGLRDALDPRLKQ